MLPGSSLHGLKCSVASLPSGHSLGFLEDKTQGPRAYQASSGARLADDPLAHAGHLTKPVWT